MSDIASSNPFLPQAFLPSASLATIATYLTEQGWPTETVNETILRTRYQGHHGEWLCLARYGAEGDQCLFYSIAPLRAPEVLRPAVAEYLTRANWGLILGNFEIDYGDGEIRFKTSLQLNGTALTVALLHPLIYANVAIMDKYLPGLQAVVALTQTPLGAILAIEAE